MKTTLALTFLSLILFNSSLLAQSANTLWYTHEADFFEESLVLGNGKMGASVFGGVASEKIYLNDATLWTGGPVNPDMNPEANTYLPAIREALRNEDYRKADSLNRFMQGSFSQSYAPLGTLYIDFNHRDSAQNYYRELNIGDAISKTRYRVGGIEFQREYFTSNPDQVMVIRLSSSKKKSLDCMLRFESLLHYQTSLEGEIYQASGFAPFKSEPNYRGNMKDAVVFDVDKGTRFSALIDIKESDCDVQVTEEGIQLKNGSKATILVSVATSFNGFDKDPVTEGLDDKALAMKQLEQASQKSYKQLKKAHIADYEEFSKRVNLSLGETSAPDLPTDERLIRYLEGKEDKNLEILYFQYGRYLLISSSRTKGVPANLQGIWNPYLRPPWSSNYTININAEENYWLAENANLSEMHMSLLSFIENISTTGKITARNYYNAGGWAACHNSDIWAMSNPVGDFGQGDPVWANWNMGGTWLSTHLWEHYIFTKDEEFLRNKGYPIMKGAAEFCLDWLIEDAEGKLITSPSTSPENKFLTPEGYAGATLYGGTADLSMIRELFIQTIKASEVLNTDEQFRQETKEALERLHPYKIGWKGNLQEWYYDWEDADPKHRHQSHLFGLYPGHHINPELSPELAKACQTTLEIKGDETTGWSKGWRINLWARLWDGNHAYKMFRELLKYVPPDGKKSNYSRGGGTYPNLFDAHPPFQIDGNFGGAAAVIEMLMQSTENEIRLLPALPDAWPEGKVEGICARGGYVLSMKWKDMELTDLTITARADGKTVLISGEKKMELSLKQGESKKVKW